MIHLDNNHIRKVFKQKETLKKGIDDILQTAFNAIMHGERDAYLQEQKKSNNKGNGYRPVKINAYGRRFMLAIPRDRLGLFKPLFMDVLKKQKQEVDQLCYELKKGIITQKIVKILEAIYTQSYSQSSIANIIQTVRERIEIKAFG